MYNRPRYANRKNQMMFRRALIVSFPAIAIALPTAAMAACGFGDINASNAQVAVVQPPKLHFVQDDALVKGCPNDGAKCQQKGYLVAGDLVLTGPTQGAYVCSGYVTAGGVEMNEWLPVAALQPAPPEQQHTSGWAGEWKMFDNDITIKPHGKEFSLTGAALWGHGDSVHTGEFEAVAAPVDGVISFTVGADKTLPFKDGDEYDCRVSMVRRGPYLLVRDNNQCGGVNVTFTGFYRTGVKARR